MTLRYGNPDCDHENVVYRKDGWEEGCAPAVCFDCGAFGCYCDSDLGKNMFFIEGLMGTLILMGSGRIRMLIKTRIK
ncbi:hypothetical protein HNV12_01595 [Methanococcoides sp. SA1]|nr:hypothetical protein [Methanococcoides sp. SA1]